MAMRLSGLMSGMDTESIVQQLVEARSNKVTKAKNEQTKLEWKQDVWKGLNSKLKSLQSKLNDLRFTGGYAKKATKVSDSSIASVLTDGSAMNGVQTMRVKQLAKTAYMTGGKVSLKENVSGELSAVTPLGFIMDFGTDAQGKEMARHITVNKADGSQVDIQMTSSTSISDVLTQLKDAGLNASFDGEQKRFFIAAKEAGAENSFMLTGDLGAMEKLGLVSSSLIDGGKVSRIDGAPGAVTAETNLSSLISFAGGNGQFLTARRMTDMGEVESSLWLRPDMTVGDFLKEVKDKWGVDAAFDEREQKFFFNRADDIREIYSEGGPGDGENVMQGLFGDRITKGEPDEHGMYKVSAKLFSSARSSGTFISGQDAKIELNGAEFSSSNNVFSVNGLTITAHAETEPGKSVTLTTAQDTDGIYDMVKDFLKTYNEVINEMDKLYGADSAKDYEPLSDDEKKSMSESEIEKYEKKIKDALLRKDANLSSVSSALKEVMLKGVKVNGVQMYLSNFGIETLSYFNAADGERNAYHINGDPDDTNTASLEDKLKKMIASDPDTVTSFFSQLTMNLYTAMDKQSKSIEGYRSYGSFYDDKKMKSDYDGYKSKIKDLEKKLADYEDKWYAKFAKMETAMAKLQKSTSAITGLLGGG